ncbi:hypothetical protein RW095_01885 [Paraburkholderia kirstenboschensis]|uniref:DDE domain-containing protein n=1 Tax=Paraburkholderia kirstenboschensis TaxID=1245436 RepID=A0ABZ0EBX9_9BURK|nr:hypothetical protein [Paraburkholderia kirstenboschensis]WOD14712.1 hypothetical protein RW095_01885 [Paraburkholderia kirstenboschensis]
MRGKWVYIHRTVDRAGQTVDFMLSVRHDEKAKVRSLKISIIRSSRTTCSIKSRTKVMPGFKRFGNAAITFSGIELVHRIRKGQLSLAKVDLKDTAAPADRLFAAEPLWHPQEALPDKNMTIPVRNCSVTGG